MIFKRGVSPLIATVLLVMITVSIGAAVMVVIQNIANEGIQSTNTASELIKCGSDVSAQVLTVSNAYRICINATGTNNYGNIALFMQNSGLRDITGFRLTVIGTNGVSDNIYSSYPLTKGSIQGMRFNFNTSKTGTGQVNISSIKLSPMITGSSGAITCTDTNTNWDTEIQSWDDCASDAWDNNI